MLLLLLRFLCLGFTLGNVVGMYLAQNYDIPNIAKKLEDFKKDVEAKKKPPNDKTTASRITWWDMAVTSASSCECGSMPRAPKQEKQSAGEIPCLSPLQMPLYQSPIVLPAVVMTSHSSSAFTSSWSTASTIGITMAVVEVLESHMESTVVQHIKQRSNLECSMGKHGESEAAEKGGEDFDALIHFPFFFPASALCADDPVSPSPVPLILLMELGNLESCEARRWPRAVVHNHECCGPQSCSSTEPVATARAGNNTAQHCNEVSIVTPTLQMRNLRQKEGRPCSQDGNEPFTHCSHALEVPVQTARSEGE
ncbi:hypothetical protein DV515_00007789, partial [Chloebia gouldiae]